MVAKVCAMVVCLWAITVPASAAQPIVAVDPNGVSDGAYLLVIQGGVASLRPIQVLGVSPVPVPPP